ncbi:prenyltransferase/squalene oxidase repeat-containing protein [Botrimarina sp.]|uniref:prenyltransferase/squalene oxidase repeat-containing protein n=1 Tax=Botrimarina sp. TaxID=2795802 RepID=UPI0032EBFC53
MPDCIHRRRPIDRFGPRRVRRVTLRVGAAALVACTLTAAPAHALLTTSSRVTDLVEKGADTLETIPLRPELGAACLVALALHKAGRPDHPRVAEAVAACKQRVGEAADVAKLDTYSHGLAIVFLAETRPERERALLGQYLTALAARQQPDGGWGYQLTGRGDTSQTQYVALALWEAYRNGVRPDASLSRGMIDWLNGTQDPSGAWGYQGIYSPSKERVQQEGVSDTMSAAGMASLMIGADLHGLLSQAELAREEDLSALELPPSVKRVEEANREVAPLPKEGVDWTRVQQSLEMGDDYIADRPVEPPNVYACYYLYALERYHAFREVRLNQLDPEPKWYEQGVKWLEDSQERPGVWNASCGEACDTAFAVLFLIRSTQKSLQRGIGEGALVSGRGLPKNLAGARLRGGQVVVDVDPVGMADFFALMDAGEAGRLDELASNPTALVLGDVSPEDAERFQQVLRTGQPTARLVAARALGRIASLDSAPTLMYGLTDPDRDVALASRDALRAIARRPAGFGMPDDYNDDQRYAALEQWKRWYLALRPEAILDFGR